MTRSLAILVAAVALLTTPAAAQIKYEHLTVFDWVTLDAQSQFLYMRGLSDMADSLNVRCENPLSYSEGMKILRDRISDGIRRNTLQGGTKMAEAYWSLLNTMGCRAVNKERF